MSVRHLDGEADVRELQRLNSLAMRTAYAGVLPDEVLSLIYVLAPEEKIQEAVEVFREDRDRILVAEDAEDGIVGYTYFRWGEDTASFVKDGEAEVKELCVDPDHWREGIGTRLLDRGVGLVPNATERVKLAMPAGNVVGRQFVTAYGFNRTRRFTSETAGESYVTELYTLGL